MAGFKFVDSQIDRLSEITANIGLFFFATIFAPLFNAVDTIPTNQLVWGLILAIFFWWTSLRLARIANK